MSSVRSVDPSLTMTQHTGRTLCLATESISPGKCPCSFQAGVISAYSNRRVSLIMLPQLLQRNCQRFDHRRLPPMQHWRRHGRPAQIAVTEMSVCGLQMFDCPLRDQDRQIEALGIPIRKRCEGLDRLRRTLDVDRVRTIVEILRPTVRFEK